MLRMLPPYFTNIKKRLIKSPKLYIRDSGIFHSFLGIKDFDALLNHPVYGSSWEGYALENTLSLLDDWDASFYRTSNATELDLVLTKGLSRYGVEFKASTTPQLPRGFWNAIEDLGLEYVWIVAPVDVRYPIRENVEVTGLQIFLQRILAGEILL